MEDSPLATSRLTSSSQAALRHAYAWAETHEPVQEKRASEAMSDMPRITSRGLLVGILRSHAGTDSSELRQLLEHFDVPVSVLERDLGLDTVAASKRERPSVPLERMALDAEANAILQRGHELADAFNPMPERLLRLKDMFGGVLLEVPNAGRSTLERHLSGGRPSFEEVASSYPDYLAYVAEDASRTLRTFLRERFPYEPAARSGPRVASYSADHGTGRDMVGIGAEVDAFAYLMSAKTLQPPLAVGLFGDWGSGKSFFLESLRQRIYKITDDARATGAPQRDMSIFKHVVQIEFNAWHYVEGDLWASLVEHIFRNLKTHPRDEPSLLRKRQEHYIAKLEAMRRVKQNVQGRGDRLADELEVKRRQVEALREERDATIEKLAEYEARDAVSAIELSENDKARFREALSSLGLDETYRSAQEYLNAFAAARSILANGTTLTAALRYRGWRWSGWLIVLVVGLPFGVTWSLSMMEADVLTNALTTIAATAGGAIAMLQEASTWLGTKVGQLEKAQLELEARRHEKEAEYAREIERLERAYTEHQAEYERAQAESAELASRLAELELALKRLTPGQVLNDFIRERVGSREYQSRLGVAALIRQDFDQLAELVREQNEHYIETDTGTPTSQEMRFNRIVLYVDDLDRCPPSRVVAVLQAVHLLMAFDLFVVVVAVDARWLSRSLQEYYATLLSPDPIANQATPQDYLEKIFQIPFWIMPLGEQARGRIVRGLLSPSLARATSHDAAPSTEASERSGGDGGTTERGDAPEAHLPDPMEARTDPSPAALELLPSELAFMEELEPLLGETPRSIKRFVNMYRLMKVMYLDATTEGADSGTSPTDSEKVLFLLAISTGLPSSVSVVLGRLRSAEPTATLEELTIELGDAGSERIADEMSTLRSWLQRRPPWKTLEAASIVEWIVPVARFSFTRSWVASR